jgi:hypothetical protein
MVVFPQATGLYIFNIRATPPLSSSLLRDTECIVLKRYGW